MTKVRFIQDFRGVETDEVYYKAGEFADVDDAWLERLIQDKRAVIVDEPKPKAKPRVRKVTVKKKVVEK